MSYLNRNVVNEYKNSNDGNAKVSSNSPVYVSWKKIIDTGVEVDGLPGIVAVGDGGILYPFEHRASDKEIKFKSACAYRDGALFIGDWRIFISSMTTNAVESTMSMDVIDCTSIKQGDIQYTYIVSSEGHVIYSSSEYPDCSFNIFKNVSDKFVGCTSGYINDTPVVILYGSSLMVGVAGANISSFSRIQPSCNNITSVSIIPNGNIAIFDKDSQSIHIIKLENFDTLSYKKEICYDFLHIRTFVESRTGISLKFNSIYCHENIMYLMGEHGFISMVKLNSDGTINCPVTGEMSNHEYSIDDFYITKILDTTWNDMIANGNHFICVGNGEIKSSMFIIDHLNNFIMSHDIRHTSIDYSNEIARILNKYNSKYTIRRKINMQIDENKNA